MKLHGKVISIFPKERVAKLQTLTQIYYLYFQRKDFKEFGPYFFEKPYIFVEVEEERKRILNFKAYPVSMFIRVVQPQHYIFTKRSKVYFDIYNNKREIKKLINKNQYRLFIDLEFTMPPIYQTMKTMTEIIQYGIIVVDGKDKEVFRGSSLVKPSRPYNLNKNTLKFLSLNREDFDNAIPYIDFYNLLNDLVKKYNPKIYVWGNNDILVLEQSFVYNKIKPISVREKHINLMALIKNYYNVKAEKGLFQTYEELTNTKLGVQKHDALEDAYFTKEIFVIFKNNVNKECF